MGKTFTGGVSRQGTVTGQSGQQQGIQSDILSQLSPDVISAFQQVLQGGSAQGREGEFEKYYVQPAQQAFEKFTVPSLKQQFADIDASSSSALNQAIAQSAADLSTQVGSQFGQFAQTQQSQVLDAIRQFLPLVTQGQQTPLFQQNAGILGPIIQALAQAGGAYAASSRKIKENIKPYIKGLTAVQNMDVNQYDYKKEYGGKKNKIGLIAEQIPEELTEEIDGILHVDLYGVMGVIINAIQELNERLVELEAMHG